QEFALNGVLTYWIHAGEGEDAVTTLGLEYRVNGASGSELDVAAADVEAMLALQLARLQRFLAGGDPEPPAPAEQEETTSWDRASANAERAAILEAWRQSAERAAA